MKGHDTALSADKILYLLDELCRTQGYCLSPHQKLRISESKSLDTKTLSSEILTASGFEPQYEEQRLEHIEVTMAHYLNAWSSRAGKD